MRASSFVIVMCTCCLLVLAMHPPAWAEAEPAGDTDLSFLAELDLSAEFDALEYEDNFFFYTVNLAPFTERERRILQKGKLDGRNVSGLSFAILESALAYIVEHGKPPQSAFDLIEFSRSDTFIIPPNGDVTYITKEIDLSPTDSHREILHQVGRYFNPATGKLLSELDDMRWRPYGVVFDVAPASRNPHATKTPGCRTIVYGATEGTVLYDQTRYAPPANISYSYGLPPQPPAPYTLNLSDVPEIDAAVMDYFLSLDFSAELAALDPVTIDDPAYSQERFFFSVDQPPMTARDLLYLAQYNFSHRGQQYCLQLSGALDDAWQFFRCHGRLPENGVELLLLKHGNLLNPQGMASFRQLTRMEQLATVHRCIDPLTGRFVTTFAAKSWQPHAIQIKAALPGQWLPDPALASMHEKLNMPDMTTCFKWDYKIFGETEGSILLEEETIIK